MKIANEKNTKQNYSYNYENSPHKKTRSLDFLSKDSLGYQQGKRKEGNPEKVGKKASMKRSERVGWGPMPIGIGRRRRTYMYILTEKKFYDCGVSLMTTCFFLS